MPTESRWLVVLITTAVVFVSAVCAIGFADSVGIVKLSGMGRKAL